MTFRVHRSWEIKVRTTGGWLKRFKAEGLLNHKPVASVSRRGDPGLEWHPYQQVLQSTTRRRREVICYASPDQTHNKGLEGKKRVRLRNFKHPPQIPPTSPLRRGGGSQTPSSSPTGQAPRDTPRIVLPPSAGMSIDVEGSLSVMPSSPSTLGSGSAQGQFPTTTSIIGDDSMPSSMQRVQSISSINSPPITYITLSKESNSNSPDDSPTSHPRHIHHDFGSPEIVSGLPPPDRHVSAPEPTIIIISGMPSPSSSSSSTDIPHSYTTFN